MYRELRGQAVDSVYDLFTGAAKRFGDKPCLGKRTATGFDWITYKDVCQWSCDSERFARAIASKLL